MKRCHLVFGGVSKERLVSVATAQNILSVLVEGSHLWFISTQGKIHPVSFSELKSHQMAFTQEFIPSQAAAFNCIEDAISVLRSAPIFLALHGTEGEDGSLQKLFMRHNLAFTGSDDVSSLLCFHKDRAKIAAEAAGLRITKSYLFDHPLSDAVTSAIFDFFERECAANNRIVLKPVADGSSFGLKILNSKTDLKRCLKEMRASPFPKYMAEPFIEGREMTVGVTENIEGKIMALPVSEVILEQGHSFDYQGKYLGKGSQEVTPASISPQEKQMCQDAALCAHKILGCAGYSRTDLILTPTGPIFLETNTLPGLSKASFIPQQLSVAKISLQEFVQNQLEISLKRLKSASAFLCFAISILLICGEGWAAYASSAAKIDILKETIQKQDISASVGFDMHWLVRERKERIWLSEDPKDTPAFATQLRIGLHSASPADIEKTVVVQWIRGCVFSAQLKKDNGAEHIQYSSPFSRIHFNKTVPFHHPDWVIDSESTDPVYSSLSDYGRFGTLQWNDDPQSLSTDHSHWYVKQKPKQGDVFISAIPGVAQLLDGTQGNESQNVSLAFKTCLFRASDVPGKSTPLGEGLVAEKALSCMQWENSFIYDFSKKAFYSTHNLHPYCLTQLP